MIDATPALMSRLRSWGAAGVGLLIVAIVVVGCDAVTSQDLGDADPQKPTIKQYVEEVRALSSLEEVATKADLLNALEQDNITVFAPTNAAFDGIDKTDLLSDANSELLSEVLQYHIVPQVVKLREGDNAIGEGNSATYTTVEGDPLTIQVTDGGATVNGQSISNGDADASNGVVHVTDGVLLETADVVDRAELMPTFRTLRRLIGETGLEGVLRGTGPGPNPGDGLTVFAPTNAAFSEAGSIANPEDVLKYHVLNQVFRLDDIPVGSSDVETLEGSDVTIVGFDNDNNGRTDSVTVDGIPVATPDVTVENGVLHSLDTVLSP